MAVIPDVDLFYVDGELNAGFSFDLAQSIAEEFFFGVNLAIRSMLGYVGEGGSSSNAAAFGDANLTFANEEDKPLRGIEENGEDWYHFSVEYSSGLLSRPSLVPESFSGLNDVVAAFSMGWDIQAKKLPRGLWRSRKLWVSAKRHRDPNGALADFAESFESKYPMVRVSLPSEWGRD